MEYDWERDRAAAIAAHVPELAAGPLEEAILRNAKRQLMALQPEDIPVLGYLLSKDVWSINEALRSGHGLLGQAPRYVDLAGYTSIQNFVNKATPVFASLGSDLALDETLRLYRGVGIPEEPSAYHPDLGGLSGHLGQDDPWNSTFTDPGFGFAATDPAEALRYKGDDNTNGYPVKTPALIEMTVHTGLCVPSLQIRSAALFHHTFDNKGFFSTGMTQVIFPPGTKWRILSVDKVSEHPVPLIRMEQI